MSLSAIDWVFHQLIQPASHKFVLLALADFAGQDMEVWATLETLSCKTSLNRKTIIQALTDLESLGYLTDTGRRKGATKLVKIYLMNTSTNQDMTLDKQYRKRNSTENGTVPKTDGNSTVFTSETVPKTDGNSTENGTQTVYEPIHRTVYEPLAGKGSILSEEELAEVDAFSGVAPAPSRRSQQKKQEYRNQVIDTLTQAFRDVKYPDLVGTELRTALVNEGRKHFATFVTEDGVSSVTPERMTEVVYAIATKDSWVGDDLTRLRPATVVAKWDDYASLPKTPPVAAIPPLPPLKKETLAALGTDSLAMAHSALGAATADVRRDKTKPMTPEQRVQILERAKVYIARWSNDV